MIPIGPVGRTAGGGGGERGGSGGVSSRVSGGVGTRTGSATTPFLEAIRRAYSGFTLNYTFGSCKPICQEREKSLTRTSSREGVVHIGSSVDCRLGG